MCEMCDDPTMTPREALERTYRRVQRYGWAIEYIEQERGRPPWAYTVGLTEAGLPELFLTGMGTKGTARVLNGYAGHLLHAEPAAPGDQFRLRGGPLVEIVELSNPDAHLLTACTFYGAERVRALQLVWADDRQRLPWHSGFHCRRGGQPVLGLRAPMRRRVDGGSRVFI